jgi:trans-2,3-dihydro-3-hydroxyanthranilate isomerase
LAAVGEIAVAGERAEIVFEEAVGPVRVELRREAGRPTSATLWAAQLPEVGPTPAAPDVAALVGLAPSDLADRERFPRAASCGVPFLLIAVRDRATLGRIVLDRVRWNAMLAGAWAPHVLCFAADPELPDSQLRARMFAPAMGIAEDPATGAAATALAGYLGVTDAARDGTLRWVIEQGYEMGRPSLLETEVDKRGGAVVAVRVGGSTVLVSEGTMEVGD